MRDVEEQDYRERRKCISVERIVPFSVSVHLEKREYESLCVIHLVPRYII